VVVWAEKEGGGGVRDVPWMVVLKGHHSLEHVAAAAFAAAAMPYSMARQLHGNHQTAASCCWRSTSHMRHHDLILPATRAAACKHPPWGGGMHVC
jgi:hypothetical protein